jgi:hypothetical protein
VERCVCWPARVDLQHETDWRPDASSFILFSFACVAPLFFIPRLQPLLPPKPRQAKLGALMNFLYAA